MQEELKKREEQRRLQRAQRCGADAEQRVKQESEKIDVVKKDEVVKNNLQKREYSDVVNITVTNTK